jgi:sigma-B regulation protein RsbU (phosphoserine phosphatase)
VGFYSNSRKTFSYVNAGHNPPILLRDDGTIDLLDKGGLLLGAMANMPYEQGTVSLLKGDLIFLYTDGISEAENSRGDMFGERRIERLLKRNSDSTPEKLLAELDSEVAAFIGETPLSDDFTTLVARVK